jgi:hypothetical protein
MTKEQASQIINQAISSMRLTFQEHNALQSALRVLIEPTVKISKPEDNGGKDASKSK